MFGFSVGALCGGLGFLAAQHLLASCLLRSIFGTMGLKSTWDFIQDLQRGDWARAIMDGLGAVLAFWGASTNYYRGGGLGNSGGGSNAGSASDDAAGAADDAANAADDAANAADDVAGTGQNLVDGSGMTTDDALTSAEYFLGSGYKEVAPGVFRSNDGLRQVRMTNADITGLHAGGPHINFEEGVSITNPGGRVTFKVTENIHISIDG